MADPKPTGEPGGESVVSAEAEKLVRSWAYVDCITDEHDGGDLFTTLVDLISSTLEALKKERDENIGAAFGFTHSKHCPMTHAGTPGVQIKCLACTREESEEAARREERWRCAKLVEARADSLYVWMGKFKIGTPERMDKRLRAGELYEAVKLIRARPTPKAPEGAPEYRALTEAREREEKNIFVPTGQVGIRCVCGHLKSEHRYILGCTVLDCACGPGCIHAGFVDAVAAPEGGETGPAPDPALLGALKGALRKRRSR